MSETPQQDRDQHVKIPTGFPTRALTPKERVYLARWLWSSWVSLTHSASLEIGTQTSVAKTSLPGMRARVAQKASWRACQRR